MGSDHPIVGLMTVEAYTEKLKAVGSSTKQSLGVLVTMKLWMILTMCWEEM